MTGAIVGLIALLLCLGLFSGTEIAFLSASKLRVELRREKGSRRGAILARFYERPAAFLGAMLVGLNIVLVVFTLAMNELLSPLLLPLVRGEAAFMIVAAVWVTLLVLVFGEFLPKAVFRVFSDELLFSIAFPLRWLQRLLSVPAWIVTLLSGSLLRLLTRVPADHSEVAFTALDLENYIRNTRTADTEEEIDTTLFGKALYLKNVRVKDCMVPRTEVVCIDVSETVEALRQLFIETKLSRILVTNNDDIDEIIGYVHHQQMIATPRRIDKMVMGIPIVPETMKADALLNYFRKQHTNIACVVDEYGGTAGIVTMEDLLEQIFGDIDDEHDEEEYVEIRVSEHEFLFSGRLEVDYLNEKFGLTLPKGEYHTLSGYLTTALGSIPPAGKPIELEGYRFVPELVSDTKIDTVRVFTLPEEA